MPFLSLPNKAGCPSCHYQIRLYALPITTIDFTGIQTHKSMHQAMHLTAMNRLQIGSSLSSLCAQQSTLSLSQHTDWWRSCLMVNFVYRKQKGLSRFLRTCLHTFFWMNIFISYCYTSRGVWKNDFLAQSGGPKNYSSFLYKGCMGTPAV